jgi:hypothetical protein
MSNDDRPKFSVVSNDDIEVNEHGVLTRRVVLDEQDGSADFMAGIYVGTIITQLQQAKFAGMEFDQLHPMPAAKSHLEVLRRMADHYQAVVEFEPMTEDEEMVWCNFVNKRATIKVVSFPKNRNKEENG